jgi:hypothetical protein
MEHISAKEYWDLEQYLFEEHNKSYSSPEDYQELEDLICTIKQPNWKSGGSFFEWRDKSVTHG